MDDAALELFFNEILARARQGNRFFILAPHGVYRRIHETGRHLLHVNIVVERLPRFFVPGAVRSAQERFKGQHPDLEIVADTAELPLMVGRETMPDAGQKKIVASAEV